METPKYAHGHPQLASVAIQQATTLAKNLVTLQRNETRLREFEYYDKGTMATVGRNLAVVDIPLPKAFGTKLHFRGFIAWFIWMSLHLMLILGVKNRFFVFSNWVYNYFTYDQSLRLIFPEFNKAKKRSEALANQRK
jgi:NADH dehydrogenase